MVNHILVVLFIRVDNVIQTNNEQFLFYSSIQLIYNYNSVVFMCENLY